MSTRLRVGVAVVALTLSVCGLASSAQAGPVFIAGVDAEEGGPGGHGDISIWIQLANRMKRGVTNGESGLLVVGAGKDATQSDALFWNEVATGSSQQLTYVNGSGISAIKFSDYGTVAVASADEIVDDGLGVTQAENDLLEKRKRSIADFVNNGGALIAFSQSGLTNPYAYLARLGNFDTNLDLNYDDVRPTRAGQAFGITNAFDIPFYHDEFVRFPGFLKVLARNADTGEAAILGGGAVVVDDRRPSSSRTNLPSCSPTGRLRISVRDRGGAGPGRVLYRIDGGKLRRKRTNNKAGASRGRAIIRVPNGRHRITYFSEDRAGNRERARHSELVRVDKIGRCAARISPRFTG